MIANFTHFVITRFNIKQTIWATDKKGFDVNNDVWLKERYELFERYCLQSMKQQSNKAFKWLVYFDSDTPEFYKHKNEVLATTFPNFNAKYVDNFKSFEANLPLHIHNLLIDTSSFVITTRLDNDDCLHKDAIKTIQGHFVAKSMMMIDLKQGLTLQILKPIKLALRKDVHSGPFISLIEELNINKALLTVYNREHTSWDNDVEFIPVISGFYWLQIIHNRNITNQLGKLLTFNKKYLKGYEFLEPIHFSLSYYIFILLKQTKVYNILRKLKRAMQK